MRTFPMAMCSPQRGIMASLRRVAMTRVTSHRLSRGTALDRCEVGYDGRMGGLTFVTLGVGDAFSARWYSSSLAVGCGDAWLLVDCPHPIRKLLKEASESVGRTLD